MRIENEVKLDYKDVLIRPKRSVLRSRKEVELRRTYKFRNSGNTWWGVPIMSANMDGVGTFNMAHELAKHEMFTCITKQNTPKDWYNQFGEIDADYLAISVGTNLEDYEKAQEVIATCNLNWICIDIANGYSEHFVDFVRKVRNDYPKLNIIAGNVVTSDMTQELILAGADIVKVGIGPGCFSAGSQVNTEYGSKSIEDISVGDFVWTHKNRLRKVLNTFTHEGKHEFVVINGIESTPNHEYYVLNKKFKDIVNDDNIHEYAEWVSAESLTKEYFLLEMN